VSHRRGRGPALQAGQVLGDWTLIEKIGGGGNGVVWRASRTGSPYRAIKILHKVDATSFARFKAEVQALALAKDIPGIIPMLESHLPDDATDGHRWFAMPLARPFDTLVSGRQPIDVVREFITLARTLSDLHEREIYHRDIKPPNLLVFDGRLCFSDFGLVKFPRREDITVPKRDVGPKFTMAPEMRRDAVNAKGGPADVYSFSKTLWIALTGQPLAFDGQYFAESYLGLRRLLPGIYTTTLDELIAECTDNDPSARPPISAVITRLEEWIVLESDFETRNLKEWIELQNKLFPVGSPERVAWTDIDSICSVLRLVAQVPSLNHMFFPGGGGMTIEAVSKAEEAGLIVLQHGHSTVLKPLKLTFESFGPGSEWNYFRLEAEPIPPTDIEAVSGDGYLEELCELTPGHYVDFEAWLANEYHGERLPESARPVVRYLKGSFVFFSTRSPYNLDPSTYDARHNKMSEDEFRNYIARNAARRPRQRAGIRSASQTRGP
jgi:serine/threonine protein kinase